VYLDILIEFIGCTNLRGSCSIELTILNLSVTCQFMSRWVHVTSLFTDSHRNQTRSVTNSVLPLVLAKESGNFPSMKGMTKKKSWQIEDKGSLSLPTGDDSVVLDSTVRQLTKCPSQASTKNFSTMCFVCAKGRLVKADEDVCRFEGTL
jgi:hypothetical protein